METVYLMVGEGPADNCQTVATDMKLAGMGCCIGVTALIEGLAGLGTRPGWCNVSETQLLLLPNTGR